MVVYALGEKRGWLPGVGPDAAYPQSVMQHNFNQLEQDILRWIKEHDPANGLAAQIDKAVFRSREHTGVGFYVEFDVPEDAPRLAPVADPHSGPEIISRELEFGAGTLLWQKDGRVSCLEIYAYGDRFPETLGEYQLEPGLHNPRVQSDATTRTDGRDD